MIPQLTYFFTEGTNVPTNALSTDQLTNSQFVELCQLTRETWLTPIEALSKDELLDLSYHTREVFMCINATGCVGDYEKQNCPEKLEFKLWADREDDDDELPSIDMLKNIK